MTNGEMSESYKTNITVKDSTKSINMKEKEERIVPHKILNFRKVEKHAQDNDRFYLI